ncbi:MAG: preprotein translocase subunit YajC [Akkermansia sp.]|nr:preprotein translocase subunit YajC [Akkermansia sp.]
MNALFLLADGAAPQGAGLGGFIPIILIVVIMYFILIRPQQKQQKELRERQNNLQSGDKVVTAGGIYGIIREVKDATVKLEIAPNTVIKVARTSIVSNVAKDGSADAPAAQK